MYTDRFHFFVLAAELGSFSAVARKLNKAQSIISTGIANLEIDTGLTLFDRSKRNPVLTPEGTALLPFARSILRSEQEFNALAGSMADGIEHDLCLVVEQAIGLHGLEDILQEFAETYPHLNLTLLTPAAQEVEDLFATGRADLGLMLEREAYPSDFMFRGVGFARFLPVCAPSHPLARQIEVSYADLRSHLQLILRAPSPRPPSEYEATSPHIWQADSTEAVLALLKTGMGWAELSYSTIRKALETGELTLLRYTFQQCENQQGIDAVWTEKRALGPAGQWLRGKLLALPQSHWQS